jgi:hypothetical protein
MSAVIAQLGLPGVTELAIVLLIFLLLAVPLVGGVLVVAVLVRRGVIGDDDSDPTQDQNAEE